MKIIIERDDFDDYIEIIMSLEEINRLVKRKLILKEVKNGFNKKTLGICIRRDDYGCQEEDEED